LPVEIVEHDAGFDDAGLVLDIERDQAVEVFGEVDDDAVIDGLAALRGAAAARRDLAACVARDRKRAQRLVGRARDHDGFRHDLVERGIGGITAAVERVEEDLAREFARQPLFQFRRAGIGHSRSTNAGCGLSRIQPKCKP